MTDLRHKLEAADDGSTQLDIDFAAEIWPDKIEAHATAAWGGSLPAYTSDLQAAYNAIPPDWFLDVLHESGGHIQAQLWRENSAPRAAFVGFKTDDWHPKSLQCALCMVVVMAHRTEGRERGNG